MTARKYICYNSMRKYRVVHTALDPEKIRCVQKYIEDF